VNPRGKVNLNYREQKYGSLGLRFSPVDE